MLWLPSFLFLTAVIFKCKCSQRRKNKRKGLPVRERHTLVIYTRNYMTFEISFKISESVHDPLSETVIETLIAINFEN